MEIDQAGLLQIRTIEALRMKAGTAALSGHDASGAPWWTRAKEVCIAGKVAGEPGVGSPVGERNATSLPVRLGRCMCVYVSVFFFACLC